MIVEVFATRGRVLQGGAGVLWVVVGVVGGAARVDIGSSQTMTTSTPTMTAAVVATFRRTTEPMILLPMTAPIRTATMPRFPPLLRLRSNPNSTH